MTKKEREDIEAFQAICGIFHFYGMKTLIVPIIYIILILNHGWSDAVKVVIALPMFFYFIFICEYLALNKKGKEKIKEDAKGILRFLVSIIAASLFVYFIIQI